MPGPELLQLLADNAIDILHRIALAPVTAYEYISPSVEAILGYSPDEFYADASLGLAIMHPDDRARAASPDPVPQVMRSIARDGRVVYLEVRNQVIRDVHGAAVAIEGIARDVTERVTADEAVRRSEANLRAVIEFAPDLLVVCTPDGRIAYANRATLDFMQLSLEAVLGRNVIEVLALDDRQRARDRLSQVFDRGAAPAPMLYRARRPDGSERLAEFRSLRITWDGMPCSLGYGRDVTDSRDLEARVARSERMASIGTLAAGVAHEINNPLAYVTANLERAIERVAGGDRDELAALLRDAREGADRIARIVGDIRTYARPEPGPSGPVDVVAAIERALELVQSRLRLRAQLELALAPLPPITGDEARLVQVFVNLLVNAVEALPDGQADRHHIRVAAYRERDGELVTVEIRDDGPGIPADVLGRVFEPFFTTKPVGAGMGLGLAICHGIVTSLGGDILVTSEPGRGTAFRVLLPAGAPIAADLTPPRAPPPPATARARVLVIDDEVVLTRIMTAALRDCHDVIAATSAGEALDHLRGGATFDVVFCDLMMPRMTGMDFFAALADIAPDLQGRVVFLTGGTFTETAASFLARVANPRLEKPFPLRALHDAVAAILPR